MAPDIDTLLRDRAERRRRLALGRALAALEALAAQGVEAVVVGSLARGTFLNHSDVDVLVRSHPGRTLEEVVGLVEKAMGDFPFDVVFEELLPAADRPFVMEAMLDAPALRAFDAPA